MLVASLRRYISPQCGDGLSAFGLLPALVQLNGVGHLTKRAFGGAAATEICLGIKWPVESMWGPSLLFDFFILCWFMVFRHSFIRLVWRFFPLDVVDPRKARHVSLG
jgi:hypothetical protein